MKPITSPFQAVIEVFYRPNAVFATLDKVNNWSWIPFLLISIAIVLPGFMYWGFVDIEWYKEMYIATLQGQDLAPAQINAMAESINATTYQYGSLLAPLFIVIVNAIMAVYLLATTKIDDDNLNGFTDWYGLLWWTGLPMIIGSVVALGLIATANDPQLSPLVLQPTSLAYLTGMSLSDNWVGFAQGLKLESLWMIYLCAVGISKWTNIKGATAWAIAAAPTVLIFGIWALYKVI